MTGSKPHLYFILQWTENAGGISTTSHRRGKTVRKKTFLQFIKCFYKKKYGMMYFQWKNAPTYMYIFKCYTRACVLIYVVCFCFVRCSDAQDRQDRANKTLVNVKAGIEHLADKLQHLKAVSIVWAVPCFPALAIHEFRCFSTFPSFLRKCYPFHLFPQLSPVPCFPRLSTFFFPIHVIRSTFFHACQPFRVFPRL